MSNMLLTAEQAAEELKLHPKTVRRLIREGRLAATKIGKAYRIERAKLDAFAGRRAAGGAAPAAEARATCVIDIPHIAPAEAERTANFLNAAAMAGEARTPPLQFTTAFDPSTEHLKVVVVGHPVDAVRLLELMQVQMGWRR